MDHSDAVTETVYESITLDHALVSRITSPRKEPSFDFIDIPDHSVLPAELPGEARSALQQALEAKALSNIFGWIVQKLADNGDVYELMELYLKSYEERVIKVMGERLKDYRPVLNVAILFKCWQLLPASRKSLAAVGVNPQFMETWIKKRILAQLVDRSSADIEIALELYRERSASFLDDKINLLLPKTCLKASSIPQEKKSPPS